MSARTEERGPVSKRWIIGNANAAVLPVPVCAKPIKSFPESTGGILWIWIGVGILYPNPLILSKMRECKLNESKLTENPLNDDGF
jgi:hypothetical protein